MSLDGRLVGRRVLLVEDQTFIAMDIERALLKEGCEVIGPAVRLKPALELASHEAIDFCLLDVNLFGEITFAVAEMLSSRGIPFVLTTGYGTAALPAERMYWEVVSKPYDCNRVVDLVVARLAKRG